MLNCCLCFKKRKNKDCYEISTDLENRLFDAIEENDIHTFLQIMDTGVDVNMKHACYNRTLFMHAIDYKQTEIALQLIVMGAHVDGGSNILYAVQNNCDPLIIKAFVHYGGNINERFDGSTLLIKAMEKNCDKSLIAELINCGSYINVSNHQGRTPLMSAICKECKFKKYCTNKDNVLILLNNDADVNCFDLDGDTVLHGKICSDLIRVFVDHGALVDAVGAFNRTPLIASVVSNEVYDETDNIETFLSLGADPNWADDYLNTPLHYASKSEIVNLLIYYGGNINAKNSQNRSPLYYLLSNRYERVKALIKHYLLRGEEQLREVLDENLIDILHVFIKDCQAELDEMKTTSIRHGLTVYDFCCKKRYIFSKTVNIASYDYVYIYPKVRELFPLYSDIVLLNLRYNRIEKKKRDLSKHLINGLTLETNSTCIQLNYDCFYCISKFLNYGEVYNMFLASLTL